MSFLAITACTLALLQPQDSKELTELAREGLLAARAGFETHWMESDYEADGAAEVPPEGTLELVHYSSPAGELVAYRNARHEGGARRPALVWAHGGFGGIGAWLWEDGSPLEPFLQRGFVVFAPAWRGENDNPGRFELFYGELDDALAAIEHVAGLEEVDPARVYMAGHSTGGTITLLAALASPKLRAAFSFGGAPDVLRVVEDGEGYGNTPYPYDAPKESWLRSPLPFVASLKTPTFYFEGEQSFYVEDAERMQVAAKRARAPFQAIVIERGDHFNVLRPYLELVAAELEADSGEECQVDFSKAELRDTHRRFLAARMTGMLAERLERDARNLELWKQLGGDDSGPVSVRFSLADYYEPKAMKKAVSLLKRRKLKPGAIVAGEDDEGDAFFTVTVVVELSPTLEAIHERSRDLLEVADETGVIYTGWTIGDA